MKTFGFFAVAGPALALVGFAAPALASPNAFWMFGWSAHYNHGTGGLADAGDTARTATLADAAPAILTIAAPIAPALVVPDTAAPLQFASNDGVPTR